MHCPYCNNEMEMGYIQSRDNLGWSKKKSMLPALQSALYTFNTELGTTVVAYRCKECKKIVIDYEDNML